MAYRRLHEAEPSTRRHSVQFHARDEPHSPAPAAKVGLEIRVTFEGMADCTAEELRALAWQELEAWRRQLTASDWIERSRVDVELPTSVASEGPYFMPIEKRPPRPKLDWQPPPLPEKDLQTCHQLLEALLLMGVHGRAVSTTELLKKRKVPQQALYRILQPDSEAYHYLEPYIHDMKSHGRHLLDLTPTGKILASRIRTGEL